MVVRSKASLVIRKTTLADAEAINRIVCKVYPGILPYPVDAIRAQINHFAEGQFVVEFDGKVVGYCMTFIIDEVSAFKQHTWKEITGSAMASRHDPLGDWLYGMDICVDPDYRGMKIGGRLYNERKRLCQDLRLKGIVFGGRIPGFAKKQKKYGTAEAYLADVAAKKIKDLTISFQMRNGFVPVGILPNYLPSDTESLGHAALMRWDNPMMEKVNGKSVSFKIDTNENVRVCTINFQQRRIHSFEEFASIITYFVDVAADYSCDFVCFPEFVTMPLLSIANEELPPVAAMETLNSYTQDYLDLMKQLAIKYNINIIGGTHIQKGDDGKLRNICHVFLRDGSTHSQPKIHPTPSERYWWDIQGGEQLPVINTDKGPIGIMVCYDSEFPELARHLIDQGAKILFVPFATDTRQGYLRVRYCCQARTIENQCYVVLSGNVGNLPRVHNMDINYAQSCILTPSDFPFARDGVAADTDANVEMVAVADLSMSDLTKFRNNGTVLNLKDRRHDLYRVTWLNKQ